MNPNPTASAARAPHPAARPATCVPATWLALSLVFTAPAALGQAAPASDAESPEIPPSRFVTPDMMQSHIASMTAKLAMQTRKHDPFGQVQDPNAKPPVVKKSTPRLRRMEPTKTRSFASIIQQIQVNTIMPAEERFLIGTRSIRKGDRFPINFPGGSVDVEVIGVSSRKIDFKNLDSEETASVELNLLPPGMTPGSNGISAPGMLPEQKDAPLEIGPSTNF